MLFTALGPATGCGNTARIVKAAHASATSLRQAALALGLVTADEFDALVPLETKLAPADRDQFGSQPK
jgi:fumarate hydratase, class II